MIIALNMFNIKNSLSPFDAAFPPAHPPATQITASTFSPLNKEPTCVTTLAS